MVYDLISLANRYGLQHLGQKAPKPNLNIQRHSLKAYSPVLEGLKSKKIADLVYKARSHPSSLAALVLSLLFEHKFSSGPDGLWQLFDYTSLLRQADCKNIIPIFLLQDGPIPPFALPDEGREAVGLPLIQFPCFVIYLPSIPDEALLDPSLTSGGILFIMKRYKDIRLMNAAGHAAVRTALKYFQGLSGAHQLLLFDIGWQYLFSLNTSLNEVTMKNLETEITPPGEQVVLTQQFRTITESIADEYEQKGRQEGRQEGEQKGRQAEKIDSVRRMLRVGLDTAQIRVVSGLSDTEIEKIKNSG